MSFLRFLMLLGACLGLPIFLSGFFAFMMGSTFPVAVILMIAGLTIFVMCNRLHEKWNKTEGTQK